MNKMQHEPNAFQLDVHGAYLRDTDLSNANLEGANLNGADFTGAIFRPANFRNARLKGTILRGADLTDAINLTQEQLDSAIINDQTRLPMLAAGNAPAK